MRPRSYFILLLETAVRDSCHISGILRSTALLYLWSLLCLSCCPQLVLSSLFSLPIGMGAIITPEDGQSTIFHATLISLLVITSIAIVLRVISRVVARLGLWWDDYLVMLSEVRMPAAIVARR